jgi:ABC-type transport system substrate-binding protein
VRLVANPHWVGARGNVAEIHASNAGPEEALDEWRAGRYDVLGTLGSVDDEPDTLTETYSNLSLMFLGFRVDRAPFDDVLVRRAVAHALDKERFAAAVSPIALPATRGGAIPPAIPGHSHRIGLPHDLELARKLLADAGYPGGRGLPELRLVLHRTAEADELCAQLGELGMRVTASINPGPVGPRHVEDAQLFVSRWTADFPDPEGLFQGFFGENWPFYRDEQVEELLERARLSQVQSERMRLLHELDRLWVGEHAAVVPLLYSRANLLWRPWVEGTYANAQWGIALDTAVVSRGS